MKYIALLRRDIKKRRRSQNVSLPLVFCCFGGIAFLAFDGIWAAILFGWLGAMVRATGDEIIMRAIALEHSRAMFEYDGDLEQLETRLKAHGAVDDALG